MPAVVVFAVCSGLTLSWMAFSTASSSCCWWSADTLASCALRRRARSIISSSVISETSQQRFRSEILHQTFFFYNFLWLSLHTFGFGFVFPFSASFVSCWWKEGHRKLILEEQQVTVLMEPDMSKSDSDQDLHFVLPHCLHLHHLCPPVCPGPSVCSQRGRLLLFDSFLICTRALVTDRDRYRAKRHSSKHMSSVLLL